jgi:hypothetical protein
MIPVRDMDRSSPPRGPVAAGSRQSLAHPYSDYLERLAADRAARGEPPASDVADERYWTELRRQRAEQRAAP